jgi:phosphopantothenoylcysteine decarboxylase / phosphopantothenate---cysteine ligase
LRIVLGVTGSISAYKSYDLLRGLLKRGHEVRVVLTQGASQFVNAQVFRYLGAHSVYEDQEDFEHPKLPGQAPVLHVELAQWAQRLVVAPLSANTLADFCMARASNLLSTLFLALPQETPILLFPAMNTKMLHHPFVQENFNLLERLERHPNLYIAPTATGLLACNDEGDGKLLDLQTLIELSINLFPQSKQTSSTALITMGATITPLDPVRFLTNPSSGLTGAHLATHCHQKGQKVIVIAGSEAYEKFTWLSFLPNLILVQARTTQDMALLVQENLPQIDTYYSPAAISDLEFETSPTKLKKDQLNEQLSIRPATDILKMVLSHKKPHQKVIGFAAETVFDDEALKWKMTEKPVDVLVATLVHGGDQENLRQGFDQDQATYRLYAKNKIVFEGLLKKEDLPAMLDNYL